MAPLPAVRVTPARPFSRMGLDYAGPFQPRTTKGRGHKSYKRYVCVSICLFMRAIHLEVVSDLSSQAFLSAFTRFIARRGLCCELLSDNDTNFQGGSAELQRPTTLLPPSTMRLSGCRSTRSHLEIHPSSSSSFRWPLGGCSQGVQAPSSTGVRRRHPHLRGIVYIGRPGGGLSQLQTPLSPQR